MLGKELVLPVFEGLDVGLEFSWGFGWCIHVVRVELLFVDV